MCVCVCVPCVSVCECVCVCVAHTTILMYVLHLTFRCVISFFVGADITFSGIGKAQKHCNKEFFSCPGSVSHRPQSNPKIMLSYEKTRHNLYSNISSTESIKHNLLGERTETCSIFHWLLTVYVSCREKWATCHVCVCVCLCVCV